MKVAESNGLFTMPNMNVLVITNYIFVFRVIFVEISQLIYFTIAILNNFQKRCIHEHPILAHINCRDLGGHITLRSYMYDVT